MYYVSRGQIKKVQLAETQPKNKNEIRVVAEWSSEDTCLLPCKTKQKIGEQSVFAYYATQSVSEAKTIATDFLQACIDDHTTKIGQHKFAIERAQKQLSELNDLPEQP